MIGSHNRFTGIISEEAARKAIAASVPQELRTKTFLHSKQEWNSPVRRYNYETP
jgi:hypothetical protein